MDVLTVGFANETEYMNALFQMENVRLQFFFREVLTTSRQGLRSVNRFMPTAEEIEVFLQQKYETRVDGENLEIMESWSLYFNKRVALGKEKGIIYGFEEFCNCFGLSNFEKSVLALSVLASIDSEYKSVFQYFQSDVDKPYPTLEMCGKLYFNGKVNGSSDIYKNIAPYIKNLSKIFPSVAQSENPYSEMLIPGNRLISMIWKDLLKGGENGEGYPAYLELLECDNLAPLFFREKQLCQLENLLKESGNQTICVSLSGEKGSGKKHLLKHVMKCEKKQMVCLDISKMDFEEMDKWQIAVNTAIREVKYLKGILVVLNYNNSLGQNLEGISSWIKKRTKDELEMVIFVSNDEDPQYNDNLIVKINFPELNEEERCKVWEFYAGDQDSSDISFASIANTFIFTPGQIVDSLASAKLMAKSQGCPVNKEILSKACCTHVSHLLSEKANRVNALFTWEDIKLQNEDKSILRDICNRVKNKHIVLTKWGFAKLLPYGGGLSAVFAGPPGTGKTMAAQVIANELGMEMYQIDLSQVVDKYIGETEKNIKMIFTEARKSNSILFFDEADSLFAKRVEAKSSNDRFANLESSLLLQCVEQYNGISILATNNYSSIDPAFIRRFKYLINFRLPDEKTRLEIWKAVMTNAAPLSDEISLAFFAKQFEFTGAYIKNIALAAAFLAAEEGGSINNIHLFRAISRELIKEGRKLDQSQLAQYGYLFEEI